MPWLNAHKHEALICFTACLPHTLSCIINHWPHLPQLRLLRWLLYRACRTPSRPYQQWQACQICCTTGQLVLDQQETWAKPSSTAPSGDQESWIHITEHTRSTRALTWLPAGILWGMTRKVPLCSILNVIARLRVQRQNENRSGDLWCQCLVWTLLYSRCEVRRWSSLRIFQWGG